MKPEYAAWIVEHCGTYEKAYGKCAEMSLRMVTAFPELRRVSGHFMSPLWGQRQHWWCVTAEKRIVDPTAHQFPSMTLAVDIPRDLATVLYVEYTGDEGDLPTGVCMDCGDEVFHGNTFCSKACEAATLAYLARDEDDELRPDEHLDSRDLYDSESLGGY